MGDGHELDVERPDREAASRVATSVTGILRRARLALALGFEQARR